MSRSLVVPALLTAAVGVPYVATHAPKWIEAQGQAATAAGGIDFESAPLDGQGGIVPPQGPGSEVYPTSTPLEGAPTHALSDVLRMDVSKEWVYGRWSRKSTSLADLNLFGVRVPLVTGTQLKDLAGSLTYYFGPDDRIHRLTFHGSTGDTTEIVAIATQRYGLSPEPGVVPGEQLFRYRRDGEIISELRSIPAPVLWESSPHDAFKVDLIVQSPHTGVPIDRIVTRQPPPAQSSPSDAANSTAQRASATPPGDGNPPSGKAPSTPADGKESWKSFFPRSRIPPSQVKDLDKQHNMW